MTDFYIKHKKFFLEEDIEFLKTLTATDEMIQNSPVMARHKKTVFVPNGFKKRYNSIVKEAQEKYNVTIFDPITYEKFIYSNYTAGHYIRSHNDLIEFESPGARKLTIVALLNNEFSGGEFRTMVPEQFNAGMVPVELEAGDVIIFPSYVPHEVCNVSDGSRITLTTWVQGPNWT